MFLGENPPQAAVISCSSEEAGDDLKLKITDAGGREMREISGHALANMNRAGIQSVCWDLRVQPIPAPAPAGGRGEAGAAGAGRPQPAAQGGAQPRFRPSRRRRTRSAPAAPRRRAAAAAAALAAAVARPGPFVLPGIYNVSLIVDGKTIDTKPLKVMSDPEVVLTEGERKKLFDMAMELHDLQRRATEAATGIGRAQHAIAGACEGSRQQDRPAGGPEDVDRRAAEGRRGARAEARDRRAAAAADSAAVAAAGAAAPPTTSSHASRSPRTA